MGVPKFYRWISERYPCLSEVVREYQIPEFDNLYLDMNGIIHNCSHPNDDDIHFRISEEKIFQDIFRYIEFLFRMIKPRKVFFMAIDGVAPRAKMNQQRGRRFRSAKDAETKETEARLRGETLPEEARFDSNCITPGTEFMDRLHQHLKYFVSNKLSNDDLWRDIKVILSGHESPGEGEHKIMDFIRYSKSQPNYDPNTRHCLYGLDADLIMLGMCSHEPHFSLLREEVKYIRSKDKRNQRDANPEAITFHLLHLSLFREYIDHEFSELKTISFGYNLENIIDDWVLMGFLVGNDFIPHIPHFHINKSSLLKLYCVYKKVLPTLDGYLNEDGILNLQRFQKYLNELKNIDIDNFNDTYADLKYFASKTGRKLFNRQNEDLVPFFESNTEPNVCDLIPRTEVVDLINSDNDSNEGYESEEVYDSSDSDKSLFMEEFALHKVEYYKTKLNLSHVNEAVLKDQAYQYIRAIQWNLHYYYNGCMSWSWYYPHHYAPYISDVNDFGDIDLTYDFGEPFKPFEQLLAVLPSASKALLPKAYECLVSSETSPLIDYYPEDFETDQNEKQQAWEAVVLIPFIDEKRLLNAVQNLEQKLTLDEKRRNSHGPHLVFTYSEEATAPFISPNASVFPNINVNHAKCEELGINGFRFPIERIHKGLCNGVLLDVYFPGFPTLKHIPHEAVVRKERVRVFESASLGENMMLTIKHNQPFNIEDVAQSYLGKCIFVNWPHLIEAKVFQVSNANVKYFIDKTNKVLIEDINDKEFEENGARINSITKKYKERWGVIAGDTEIILHVYPLTGRKYVPAIKGKVTLEKQWSTVPMVCPIQTVVKDLSIHDASFQQFRTIDDIYSSGAKCFLIDNPYYGAMAHVIECMSTEALVKVEVFPQLEPDLSEVKDRAKEIVHEKYIPNYVLAQRLGISGHLLSRITGTIFIKPANSDQRKINIGLNLKFNARNEEIPGYSIKRDDTWLFSDKIFKIMEQYLTKFPFLFEKLSSIVERDIFSIDDLIPGEQKQKTLEEIQNWLKSLPSASEKRLKSSAEILDEYVVEAVEDVVNSHLVFSAEMKSEERVYKPNQLFRPIHYMGYSLPDPKASYHLFDRVVNIRSGISVPLGAKGTIIGKHVDETKEVNTLFDILFDEPFVGGMALRCSQGKGYKLSPANLINITYGLKLSGKYAQFVSSYGQPLQVKSHQNSNSHRQKVNYQQFSSKDQNYGKPFSFGQRVHRSRIPNMSFVNSNSPNSQTEMSIQSLNHSTNSPFRSPKHGSESTQLNDSNFPAMENIWHNLTRLNINIKSNESSNLSTSPKASFAEITAPKRFVEKTKSSSRAKTQKQTQDNRSEKVSNSQNISHSNPIELLDSFRPILMKTCEAVFSQVPKFEILSVGPMKSKAVKVQLPDNHSFHTAINCHLTADDAYESVSRDALAHLNKKFGTNINLDRPNRLLPSPSFIDPKQSSPNRSKIAASALPRPPSVWIPQKSTKSRSNEEVEPHIPESFVEHNNKILRDLEKLEKSDPSFKTNTNIHTNKERYIQPKKLFTKNDNLANVRHNHNNQTHTIINDLQVSRGNSSANQSKRRNNQNSNASHSDLSVDHQFVPLQVARNNQSHRNAPKNPEPETVSLSSDDIEILTPEVLIQFSSPSSASNEIEILTPESLMQSTNASSSGSKSSKARKARMGVNLD